MLVKSVAALNHTRTMMTDCHRRRRQPEHVCTAAYGHVNDSFAALATE